MTAVDLLNEVPGGDGVEPELARVSVLGGHTQLDVGLPASVPVAALIPDLVALIESRDPDHSDPDARPQEIRDRWTLARIGGSPIAPSRSLLEAGVRDGDLLVLRPVSAQESPVLFDDVIDAVARLTDSRFPGWTAAGARVVGLVFAVVAAVLAGVVLCRVPGSAVWPVFAAAGLTVGFVTAATVVSRWYRDRVTAAILSLCAMPPAFATGMLIPPGPLGAPHLATGCAVTLLVAVLSYRITTTGTLVHAAVATTMVLFGVAALVQAIWSVGTVDVGTGLAVAGILTIALAPRLTIALARLPLPPVPSAGAPIDPVDREPRPAIEGIGAIGAMALPSAAALERRAYAATQYHTGILAGAAVASSGGALLCVLTGARFDWRAGLFALIIGIVLCLRGRSHDDLAQACTLIGAGAVTVLAMFVGVAATRSYMAPAAFAVLAATAVIALLVGVVAPHQEFSPVLRRTAELAEYALIAVIVPLGFWIMDLYGVLRNL
ncbi:type VII secretion integral membrane protein EccD [Williamsia sterculiae]|uniref:Type VII secretion integral membrane protein EccD n=1 Tax=Williamsia sterculiae TaxID=1344003 RepID=A0A1N7DT79_9NOCA|nr:type VII secretion integral membrane protein EccD [Williamsia sterculiae]SIR79047.1 type VII secretion integral membrane protein EccD [Williamsia sterculiae]